MVDTVQWIRLHPDYLHCIEVSRCDAYMYLRLCIGRGVCACMEACRLARISCYVG